MLKLHPKELIADITRVDAFLRPDSIPVHPSVYAHESFYNADFIEQVRGRLVGVVVEDLQAIEEKAGRKVEYYLSGDKILRTNSDDVFDFSQIRMDTNPDKKIISLDYGVNVWMRLDSRNYTENQRMLDSYNLESHPLGIEKLKQYSLNPIAKTQHLLIPTWRYKNTDGEGGFPVKLALRAFAIAYNNQGLEILNLR